MVLSGVECVQDRKFVPFFTRIRFFYGLAAAGACGGGQDWMCGTIKRLHHSLAEFFAYHTEGRMDDALETKAI